MSVNYSGSDWLKKSFKIGDMSPLGEKVGDILGQVEKGIYHYQSSALGKADWADESCIRINWFKHLSTVDDDKLTMLFVLCTDAAIRLTIQPCNMQCITLMFHQRIRPDDGEMYIPTVEEVVKDVRDKYWVEKLETGLVNEKRGEKRCTVKFKPVSEKVREISRVFDTWPDWKKNCLGDNFARSAEYILEHEEEDNE